MDKAAPFKRAMSLTLEAIHGELSPEPRTIELQTIAESEEDAMRKMYGFVEDHEKEGIDARIEYQGVVRDSDSFPGQQVHRVDLVVRGPIGGS